MICYIIGFIKKHAWKIIHLVMNMHFKALTSCAAPNNFRKTPNPQIIIRQNSRTFTTFSVLNTYAVQGQSQAVCFYVRHVGGTNSLLYGTQLFQTTTSQIHLCFGSAHLRCCKDTYARLPTPARVESRAYLTVQKKTKDFEDCRQGHAAVQKNLLKEWEENSRKGNEIQGNRPVLTRLD